MEKRASCLLSISASTLPPLPDKDPSIQSFRQQQEAVFDSRLFALLPGVSFRLLASLVTDLSRVLGAASCCLSASHRRRQERGSPSHAACLSVRCKPVGLEVTSGHKRGRIRPRRSAARPV